MTPNHDVKRVLVYRLGSLGDTLVALPSLRLAARAFPNAERRMLTNWPVASKAPAAQAVLQGTGLISEYIRYVVGVRNPLELLRLVRTIRAWKPEVLVYLAGARGLETAKRDRLFFRLCGVKRIVGLPETEDLQKNRVLDASRQLLEQEGARLARTVAELGDARLQEQASWMPGITEEDRVQVAAKLAPLQGRPLLAASLGTKQQPNDWGDENWTRLLAALATKYPQYGLVIVGGPEERERSQAIAAAWGDRFLNLCGELRPAGTGVVAAASRVFIGHDSGPIHLASAAGATCVGIYAARNLPGQWFPYGDRHRVIYHDVECKGCRLSVCIEQQKKCILSITVEEVVQAVSGILETGTSEGER